MIWQDVSTRSSQSSYRHMGCYERHRPKLLSSRMQCVDNPRWAQGKGDWTVSEAEGGRCSKILQRENGTILKAEQISIHIKPNKGTEKKTPPKSEFHLQYVFFVLHPFSLAAFWGKMDQGIHIPFMLLAEKTVQSIQWQVFLHGVTRSLKIRSKLVREEMMSIF